MKQSNHSNLKAYLTLNCAALPEDVTAAVTPVLEKFRSGTRVEAVNEMGFDIRYFRGKVGKVITCKPSRIHPYVVVDVSYGDLIRTFHPGELEVRS